MERTMTYQEDFTLPIEYLEQLGEQGTDYLPELIRNLVNAAMQIERQKHLVAGWHERTPQRQGNANSYKSKTVQTRVGGITFDIPQVREGGFYPGAFRRVCLPVSGRPIREGSSGWLGTGCGCLDRCRGEPGWKTRYSGCFGSPG
jgi:hypothetical protein